MPVIFNQSTLNLAILIVSLLANFRGFGSAKCEILCNFGGNKYRTLCHIILHRSNTRKINPTM